MRILFVCTGNTGRSAMAETIFKAKIRDHRNPMIRKIEVASAGIRADQGDGPEKLAHDVLKKQGLSLLGHTASLFVQEMVKEYDLILTMEARHRDTIVKGYNAPKERAFLLTEFVDDEGDIDDCWGREKEVYEACASRLSILIERVIEKLSK